MSSVKGIIVGVLVCYVKIFDKVISYYCRIQVTITRSQFRNHKDDEEMILSVITLVILTRILAKAYVF